MEGEVPTCPHCSEKLTAWIPPPDSAWKPERFYVCFNDECPYFVRGWQRMREKFDVSASYRLRFNPRTGTSGPLPVWSATALREFILEEDEQPDE
ncbi:MAG: ogr/Delta-like zinc finger family protein [Acidobacteriota bacterium]|nr:MAG: ogr/Delta-like zinc finger family protein [Acidobacteriota bacterium]